MTAGTMAVAKETQDEDSDLPDYDSAHDRAAWEDELDAMQAELRVDPGPLFWIGPEGSPRLDPQWAGAVADFCEAVRTAVGENPSAGWWPYRSGNAACVAFDAWGDAGEVEITILAVGRIAIQRDRREPGYYEPQVVDLVDGFYLVALLLEALGLASPESLKGFGGPRTIDK